MSEPPKYEFAKLDLKAGDILLIKSHKPLNVEAIQKIRAAAEARLPEGVTALVIGPDIDVSTITLEQAGPLIEGKAKAPAKGKKQ
jgi:hypothetical protein